MTCCLTVGPGKTKERFEKYHPTTQQGILDPCSLERSFACAETSTVKPKRSPLDHVKTEVVENVQLKKVLLSSAEEELCMATHENDTLTPLESVEIVINLDIQDRDVLYLSALPMVLVV